MLSRAPLVSVVLFFAAGILSGDAIHAPGQGPVVLVVTASILIAIAAFAAYRLRLRAALGVGMAISMMLSGVGFKLCIEEEKDARIAAVSHLEYTHYTAEVRTLPEKRDNAMRFEAKATQFRTDVRWQAIPVRALIYLPDSMARGLNPGDRIVVRGKLTVPEAPVNPEQFDYQSYLRNKGILFSAFVHTDACRVIKRKDTEVAQWPALVSRWADDRFRENIPDSSAYGLVKAMLLGRRDDLDAGQVDDYVISGAVHILSVSGMHVAILFLAITAGLGWLRRWRHGRWLYLVIMAAFLGFYALVTGLPPSVQRATLMCIVLVIAEVTGRKHHSINTLAFSALIILLFDPCALYDVGFQLSYLAMAGIFLFYDPIYRLFTPGNRIVQFVWQVSALALAAQLATFPLSLFYFHQFPTYFWLVNPFVITFTNILLPAALVLLAVSALNVASLQWFVNEVVALSAKLTDWSAGIPRHLPGFLIENLHLNAWEVSMLYLLMMAAWYTLHCRHYAFFKLSAVLIILFVSISMAESLDTFLTEEKMSYRIRKHEVMSFKKGNKLYVVCDPGFAEDQKSYYFNVRNYAIDREIQEVKFVTARR